MTRKLIRIRLLSLLAALTAQSRKKNKSGKGLLVVYLLLYLYVIAVVSGMMGVNFYTLSTPYHQLGLDWLYFAMAGLMSLGFALLGSVFTTQSQLYDAKDNAIVLSMPIPPGKILMSRIVPLLLLNLLFASMVMVPAIVVYAVCIGFSIAGLLMQLFGLLAIVFLAQALACILGWLLHLLLSKLNKSFASILYLITFLVVYFVTLSRAQDLLNAMISNSAMIADTMSTWVWPLYALGLGCTGSISRGLVMPLIGAIAFGAAYWFLSATFIKSASRTKAASKRHRLDLRQARQVSPAEAVIRKEFKKFLGTPIYLTNMGLGIVMTVALMICGVIFRKDLLGALTAFPGLDMLIPLMICSICAFLISTMCISTPSVSLEGKNIWILKVLPLSGKDILLAKLKFHNRMTIPVSCIAGGVLAAAYGCKAVDILLCILIPALLALLCGLVGLVSGLKWVRLDFISEAYPCKQSLSVAVTMFGIMGLPLILGLFYAFLFADILSPSFFLVLCCAVLGALCWVFYKLLTTWGIRKWESL